MAYTIEITEINEPNIEVTAGSTFPITISYDALQLDGVDVTNAVINVSGDLILTKSDGTTINAGQAKGPAGEGVPTGGTAGQALVKIDGTNYNTQWQTIITDVVQDTTPQLGGDLDVNGKKIISVSNADITIEPNGTGDVVLATDTLKLGDSGATFTALIANNSGQLALRDSTATKNIRIKSPDYNDGIEINTSSGQIGILSGDDDVKISSAVSTHSVYVNDVKVTTTITGGPNGTGGLEISAADSTNVKPVILQHTKGVSGYVSVDRTNNGITRVVPGSLGSAVIGQVTGGGTITVPAGGNQNISITPNGTGKVVLDGLSWPNADGVSGYVLATDGAGVLGWVNGATLGTGVYLDAVQDDSAPTLGGDLNVNGYKIKNNQTNGDVKIDSNGTGRVKLNNIAFPGTDGAAGQVIKTDGSGVLSWADKQDPTIVNDSQPAIQSTGQHWYRPVTGAFYTARNGNWDSINDDGFF